MKTNTRIHALAAAVVLTLSACAAAAPANASMAIVSPANGAKVKGPKVTVIVDAKGFKLVPANQAPVAGEGHIHFFVDAPASTVPVGQVVPLDRASVYIHAGKDPFNSRELELTPGRHTITVVMADAAHIVVAQPQPVSISIDVE
ncbi:MAG: DUF4399 domain-containing protein [Thermoflexales bacterium]